MLLPSTFAGTSATPGPAGYSEYMLTAAHAHALPPHLIPNGVLGITDEELARMRRSPRCHPLWACGCQHGSWCVAIGQLCWVHLQCGASCCNHPINQPQQHNAPGAAASKRRQRVKSRREAEAFFLSHIISPNTSGTSCEMSPQMQQLTQGHSHRTHKSQGPPPGGVAR